ncbi:chymotrypsinogen A-like isoform X1 [Convolutriloba macropyga]|uniref:chymotrypsinogen A-like isoform X1 n=1 Tax=Convolutriloba macropyga TaxID=536237 RepID=UPI003F51F7F0
MQFNILFLTIAACNICNTALSLAKGLQAPVAKKSLKNSTINLIVNGVPVENRPFYVRIIKWRNSQFICGGSIINHYFVLTAASCTTSDDVDNPIAVEVGDFTREDGRRRVQHVVRIHKPNEEYFAVKPGNSIALLQLQAPIAELSSLIFACSTDTDHGTLVGTCGMGSTSGTQHNYPTALQEIELKTNKMAKTFSVKDIWKREKCRDDVVCTTRTTRGSNICFKDEGNPLYIVNRCGPNGRPVCLYGVATHFEGKIRGNNSNQCDGRSYFAKVPHFHSWIQMVQLYGRTRHTRAENFAQK